MYIYTYEPKKLEEIENNLASYRETLLILEGLESKGFKTINEAWQSVCTKQLTKRELDKFCKLLGENIEARKDAHSWDWFSKYGGRREVTFYKIGQTWKENKKVLTISINQDLTIERHYCANSLNLVEHTIESLIDNAKKMIESYENALSLYTSIDERIRKYEELIKESVKIGYEKYIAEIDSLIYAKSL